MITRRRLFALSAAAVLAGCTPEPLLLESPREQYAVRNVVVDTSAFTGVKGRVNEFSRDEVARDIRATLASTLRRSAKGRTEVDVLVRLTDVNLVSPGQALLIGGVSNIRGVLEIKEARTGRTILAPTNVYGSAKGTYAPGGIIGAVTTRSVDSDYRQTIAGFAADVERRLFGNVRATHASSKPAPTQTGADAKPLTPEQAQAQAEANAAKRKCRTAISITACPN